MNFIIDSVLTVLFGLVMVLAVYGWGYQISRNLLTTDEARLVLAGPLGLVAFFSFGGALNVLGQVNQWTVGSLLLMGVALAGLNVVGHLKQSVTSQAGGSMRQAASRIPLSGFLAISLIFVFYILGAVSQIRNAHDDEEGYYAFAVKMAETGELGMDPYSERRLVTSLGGQSFLDAVVVLFRPVWFLNLIDSGAAFLILTFSVFLLAQAKKWDQKWSSALVVVLALLPNQSANITGHYSLVLITVALIYSSMEFLKAPTAKNSLVLGLIAGGGLAIKNTSVVFIATGFLILAVVYLIRKNSVKSIATNGVLLSAGVLVPTLTWAVALFKSNGTFFYPLLGNGNHGSNYGSFNHLDYLDLGALLVTYVNDVSGSREFLILCLIISLALVVIPRSGRKTSLMLLALALAMVLAVASALLTYATAGSVGFRYAYPFALGAVLYITLEVGARELLLRKLSVVAISLVAIVNFASSNSNLHEFAVNSRLYTGSWDSSILDDKVKIQGLQSRVPEGEPILSRLGRNYLFDFRRNPILIADYPGAASPPPGMPVFKGPALLREYLLNQGVRFVAFRHSDLFLFETYADRLDLPAWSWTRMEALNTFDFQDNLRTLSSLYCVPYNDNHQMLIDLATPSKMCKSR
jgi:hypothetical protein